MSHQFIGWLLVSMSILCASCSKNILEIEAYQPPERVCGLGLSKQARSDLESELKSQHGQANDNYQRRVQQEMNHALDNTNLSSDEKSNLINIMSKNYIDCATSSDS